MRVSVVVGALAIVLGVAGYVRGAMPQASTSSVPSRISVISAVISPSVVSSTVGSFSVVNTTKRSDRITGIVSGAGSAVRLDGTVVIPAGATRVVHFVISGLFGPLAAGDHVSLQVSFATATSQLVTAGVGAQANQAQSPQPSSGAHS